MDVDYYSLDLVYILPDSNINCRRRRSPKAEKILDRHSAVNYGGRFAIHK